MSKTFNEFFKTLSLTEIQNMDAQNSYFLPTTKFTECNHLSYEDVNTFIIKCMNLTNTDVSETFKRNVLTVVKYVLKERPRFKIYIHENDWLYDKIKEEDYECIEPSKKEFITARNCLSKCFWYIRENKLYYAEYLESWMFVLLVTRDFSYEGLKEVIDTFAINTLPPSTIVYKVLGEKALIKKIEEEPYQCTLKDITNFYNVWEKTFKNNIAYKTDALNHLMNKATIKNKIEFINALLKIKDLDLNTLRTALSKTINPYTRIRALDELDVKVFSKEAFIAYYIFYCCEREIKSIDDIDSELFASIDKQQREDILVLVMLYKYNFDKVFNCVTSNL